MIERDEITAYERATILKIIESINAEIGANGKSQKDISRLLAKKGHFHVRIGEKFQGKQAFKDVLELDSENSWAKNSLRKLNS